MFVLFLISTSEKIPTLKVGLAGVSENLPESRLSCATRGDVIQTHSPAGQPSALVPARPGLGRPDRSRDGQVQLSEAFWVEVIDPLLFLTPF